MSDVPAANRPVVDGAYALGIEMLDRGEPPAVVEQKLVDMGLTSEAAKRIVADYSRATVQSRSADGKSQMLQGALVCGGAILLIAYSYPERDYIAWVAIVLGGIRFFRGWSSR